MVERLRPGYTPVCVHIKWISSSAERSRRLQAAFRIDGMVAVTNAASIEY